MIFLSIVERICLFHLVENFSDTNFKYSKWPNVLFRYLFHYYRVIHTPSILFSSHKKSEQMTNSKLVPSLSPRKGSFCVKLHEILSNPWFSDVIAWLPHGRSWMILLPELFEKEIIPRYFRHRNLNSFMRQVNGWGFLRVHQGSDRKSYYHPVRQWLTIIDTIILVVLPQQNLAQKCKIVLPSRKATTLLADETAL